jgi:hypothetical protein
MSAHKSCLARGSFANRTQQPKRACHCPVFARVGQDPTGWRSTEGRSCPSEQSYYLRRHQSEGGGRQGGAYHALALAMRKNSPGTYREWVRVLTSCP